MTRIVPVSVSHSTLAIGNPVAMTPRTKRAAVVFLNVVGPRANLDRGFAGAGDVGFFILPPDLSGGRNLTAVNWAVPPSWCTFQRVLSISWAYPPFRHNPLWHKARSPLPAALVEFED
jgi:hypothetical protein